jgi:hypothetical protein
LCNQMTYIREYPGGGAAYISGEVAEVLHRQERNRDHDCSGSMLQVEDSVPSGVRAAVRLLLNWTEERVRKNRLPEPGSRSADSPSQ